MQLPTGDCRSHLPNTAYVREVIESSHISTRLGLTAAIMFLVMVVAAFIQSLVAAVVLLVAVGCAMWAYRGRARTEQP